MNSKLVEKMVQVGSRIEVTLVNGPQISGILTEIAPDHITIDGKIAISVEAVITVQTSQSTREKQKPQTPSTSDKKGHRHSLYRQAVEADHREKNLPKAERLYEECMKENIKFEGALKNRAMVLARLERYEEAENLLLLEDNRQKVKDKQPVDRLLVDIYQKWGQYRKAIDLLNDLLSQTQDIEKRTDIQWQIASVYLRLEDYVNAETKFRQVQERRPDDIVMKRNIAFCLLKQPEPRYDEAEEILNDIQKTSPNVKIAKLIEVIEQARATGEFTFNIKDLYGKAKQADQRGNLEEAESLYRDCLRQSIRSESVIKDLAAVLIRLDRKSEAVDLLEEYLPKAKIKESFDNALINAYQAAGYYQKAIQLLNNTLRRTQNIEEQTRIRRQIANSFFKLEDYVMAEEQFRSILKLHPDNITGQRNLALCLSKQGGYNDPEEILNEIQKISPDVNTAELLEIIENAQSSNFDPTDLSLSKFDQFILEHHIFAGLPDGRVTDRQKYRGSKTDAVYDIQTLVENAKRDKTIRPHERSRNLLSAAKIYFELEDYNEKFYRYLCRSYASLGYVAVSQDKHLDTIREWFYETLRVYSVLQDQNLDEQDAVNALSRFLFSYLGRDKIPTSAPRQNDKEDPLLQQITYINQTIKKIISDHPNTDEVFDAIGYLLNNRYAEKRILPCLYSRSNLRTAALKYLKNRGIDLSDSIKNEEDFVNGWHQLRDKNFQDSRPILVDFEFIKNNFEFVTDQLENCLNRLGNIRPKLFFQLDGERTNNLEKIFEKALQICHEVGFEERERLYDLLDEDCQHLLKEIKDNPTKLSVEVIYHIVEVIQKKVKSQYEDFLKSSKPHLKPELAKVSYPQDRKIEVQIAVVNDEDRMPASSLKLEIEDDVSLFTIDKIDNPTESLRGGGQTILIAILSLTDKAIQSKAFSLSVKVLYTIRGNREETTDTENFSIRLDSKDKFKNFENPYAPIVNAQEVKDESMFKGRKKEIGNIANVIRQSGSHSKCILVYGQYRSGKSTLRYHLKKKLEDYQTLFVVDLGNNFGNLGLYKHESVTVRVFTLILDEIRKTVQNNNRFNSLNINIPTREEIIKDAFPLQRFEEVLTELKKAMFTEFGTQQIVLLIDEFQYIYDIMLETEDFDSEFMRTWKSFLQKNLFSAVLVGQQVMAKFKDRFPNEFASMEHEPVSYLTEIEARELIEEPILKGDESRYQEQAVELILKLTGRSAFYIVIICARLVELMKHDRTDWVTEADVQKVTDELIEEFDRSNFNNFTSAGDQSDEAIPEEDALKVLTFIAKKSIKNKCYKNDIDCDIILSSSLSSSVNDILSDLVSRDVVGVEKSAYQIKVGLFEEWLIHQ